MPARPGPLLRKLFRLPGLLYRAKLGWLLGRRFVRLHHLGRRTGIPRSTTVEVIRYTKTPLEIVVAAGYGKTSDWYRNLLHHRQTTIDLGSRAIAVTAYTVPGAEAEDILLGYSREHPHAARMLARLLGFGTVAELTRQVPLVRFTAAPAPQPVPRSQNAWS